MDSPGGSPLLVRRELDEEEGCDVDNSVISGWLKFRDNKRVSNNFNSVLLNSSFNIINFKEFASVRTLMDIMSYLYSVLH